MQYAIYEENMERLVSKLTTIKNKCIKNNVDFHYEAVGEEFREVELEDGRKITTRYILIEAEGSVKHNGWRFIATIEHTGTDAGDIIRAFDTEIEVPAKYYTTEPVCEHCNTKRRRKDTYLIYNDETGEWKQVGKSCLNEFTNGLDAEAVARYISLFDHLIKGEEPYGGSQYINYYEVQEIVKYAFETVKHFGYQAATEYENRPTKTRCMEYRGLLLGQLNCGDRYKVILQNELDSVNFNPDSESCVQLAKDAIEWAANNEDENNYMHNLKVICSSRYCTVRDLGILISLASAYNRHLKHIEAEERKKAKESAEASNSNFVGNIGDRITLVPKSIQCVYSNDTIYGMTFMYKFTDESENIYMWSTSNYIDSDSHTQLTGTIKSHEEFRGVKQTWLTRCRVKEIQKEN